MTGFAKVETSNFTLSFQSDPKPRIIMSGRLAERDPGEVLDQPLDALHMELLESQVTEVDVDCAKLEFINSSGLKVLIKWISNLLKVPEEKRYKVRMILSPAQVWQQKSFSAFTRLLPRHVELVE